jgi:hypothetical protein
MLTIQTSSTHPVSHVAFSPDGNAFAVVQPHFGVTLCDRTTGRATATMSVPRVGELAAVAFCGGGRKVAVGSHKGLHLFDAATGSRVAVGTGWMFASKALAAPGDELLALTWYGPREIRLPRAAGEPLVSVSRPLKSRGAPAAVSPCGRWIVATYSRIAPSLTRVEERRVVATVDHPHRSDGRPPVAATFSPTGSRFAICDGNDVAVYDTPADRETGGGDEVSDPAGRPASALPVGPKPRLLLRPVFRLAPPDDYRPAAPPRLHFADEDGRPNLRWFPPVAFTPDGRGLLVRRPRNRVQSWDVASGCHAGEWSWRQEVTCLAVAPDGLTAVAGCRFGRAVAWDLE